MVDVKTTLPNSEMSINYDGQRGRIEVFVRNVKVLEIGESSDDKVLNLFLNTIDGSQIVDCGDEHSSDDGRFQVLRNI